MRVALLSLATAVAASPMADYLSSMEARAAAPMDDGTMDNFRFYAQHAAAAYCNAVGPSPNDSVACGGECDDVMRNGATIVATFSGDNTGIAGYVSVDDARREVVFSTRGSNNVRNFIADVLFCTRKCDFARGCKMHRGFADSWSEIAAAATAAIRRGLAAHPGYRLVLTGHSLGGAVAAIAGAYLRRDGLPADVYTFGAPRVGNDAFANFATAQPGGLLLRMTHTDDPVPRLPPMFFGYRHGGPEYWLSNGGALQNHYQAADVKVCQGIDNVDCNAAGYGFDILAHLHYLTDTADCAPAGIRWRRGDDGPSDEELSARLSAWSKQDHELVEENR